MGALGGAHQLALVQGNDERKGWESIVRGKGAQDAGGKEGGQRRALRCTGKGGTWSGWWPATGWKWALFYPFVTRRTVRRAHSARRHRHATSPRGRCWDHAPPPVDDPVRSRALGRGGRGCKKKRQAHSAQTARAAAHDGQHPQQHRRPNATALPTRSAARGAPSHRKKTQRTPTAVHGNVWQRKMKQCIRGLPPTRCWVHAPSRETSWEAREGRCRRAPLKEAARKACSPEGCQRVPRSRGAVGAQPPLAQAIWRAWEAGAGVRPGPAAGGET